jgi:hypothetical protein
MKMIDSSPPPVTHIQVTLSKFFSKLYLKTDATDGFLRKRTELGLKPDKMLWISYFVLKLLLNDWCKI